MKKNHDLKVHLSLEELAEIKKKADQLGMKPSAFLRFVGLKSSIKVEIKKP